MNRKMSVLITLLFLTCGGISQAAMRPAPSTDEKAVRLATAKFYLAIASDVENGENTNAKGETQKLSIRATNIFRKENGKWKMIGHHTDLLPYLK